MLELIARLAKDDILVGVERGREVLDLTIVYLYQQFSNFNLTLLKF
jgi:hypothetical protein